MGKKWTVMMYMVANRDQPTEDAAIADILEMQKVESIEDLNILIHLDRRGRTDRIIVTPGPGDLFFNSLPGNTNSGDPRVLKEFLEWAIADFQAEHYMLVLWGHASGLAFGPDHKDPLTIYELASVLREVKPRLAILGCNACDMSYAEGIYQLRDTAEYMIAWQNTVALKGWPYHRILNTLATGTAFSPEELGAAIVNLSNETGVRMTMLRLSRGPQLAERIQALASSLSAAQESESAEILEAFSRTAHSVPHELIDLTDLCRQLLESKGITANAVRNAAESAIEFLAPSPDDGFIVVRPPPGDRRLGGVGIYAPHLTSDLSKPYLNQSSYQHLDLMDVEKERSWAVFVYGLQSLIAGPQPNSKAALKR